MRNKKIVLNDNVLIQRDIRIDKNKTIVEALKDGFKPENADEAFIIASVDGEIIEINLSGSIILESLLNQLSRNKILDNLILVFYEIDTLNFENEMDDYVKYLFDIKIIKEID